MSAPRWWQSRTPGKAGVTLPGWWQSRIPREKRVLSAAAVALLCVVLFLVMEPVVKERQRLSAELPQLRADLAWMQSRVADAKRLRAMRGSATTESGQGLRLAQVENILRGVGIQDQISGLRPLDKQGLSVSFSDVAFSDLVEFIFRLQDSGQGRIAKAQVNRIEDQSGVVSADLALLPYQGSPE